MKALATGFLLAFISMTLNAAPLQKARFAGGCFWCMEPPFEKLPGVKSVISGYSGGRTVTPTYEDVSSGGTGHVEAVEITFDPALITYQQLLDVFWKNIDPFDDSGQFCDKGDQYRSAIFYVNGEQKKLADDSKAAIETAKGARVVTAIRPGTMFFRAEDYHQDYYKKNPVRYKFYRFNCGRDARLEAIWKP